MSDDEEDVDEEEEEEEDEDEDEEEDEEDEEEEEEGLSPEQKSAVVQEDVDILHDIFKYIDQTTLRISDRLKIESEMDHMESKRQREMQVLGGAPRRAGPPDSGGPAVSWDQYESLNDAERATLLERALTALATDDGYQGNTHQGGGKPPYYSYNR
jgi:hypothetical protein